MSNKKKPWPEDEKAAEGDVTDGATQDATNVSPSAFRENLGPDTYEVSRFQSEAAAKERAIAEGFDNNNRRLRLFEITERQGVLGDETRWEIRDQETKEVVMPCGSLLLDDPHFNDFALAEARGVAYGAIRDLTFSHYRDLRGSNTMAENKNYECKCSHALHEHKEGDESCLKCACLGFQDSESHLPEEAKKEAKLSLLRKQVGGLKLTAAQKAVVADIESQITDLSDEFISSVGTLVRQPWDPGSSWEVVEADGMSKLVRKETKVDEETVSKHAFREGQTLRIDSGIVPEDVIVRAVSDNGQYQVQSNLTGKMFVVSEKDLYDLAADDNMFGNYTIDEGEISKLF